MDSATTTGQPSMKSSAALQHERTNAVREAMLEEGMLNRPPGVDQHHLPSGDDGARSKGTRLANDDDGADFDDGKRGYPAAKGTL